MTWPANVLIIAELGANHLQDYDTACHLIDAAAEAGAGAIKLQLYKPESMAVNMDAPQFIIAEGPWAGRRLWDLYAETYLPWEWMPSLQQRIEDHGKHFVLSIYDEEGLNYAERHCRPWAYKVASFELNDRRFVRRVGCAQRRTIFSTGLATVREIDTAIHDWRRGLGAIAHPDLAILHCVTEYPARRGMALEYLREWAIEADAGPENPICGLSDHSRSVVLIPSMAVAAGARIIEKHFTLSRDNGGADASFSLEPGEFRRMVDAVREAERIMAPPAPSPYRRYRRAVYAIHDIAEGEDFTLYNIKTLRAEGAQNDEDAVIGQRATRAYSRGEAIT